VVRGVAGEHIGQAGLHAQADHGQQTGVLPGGRERELLVAQLHAGLRVRPGRMRLRRRHRHVEVRAAGVERGVEDRHHEPRVARVDDHVGSVVVRERGHRRGVARVDAGRHHRAAGAAPPVEGVEDGGRARDVEIRQHQVVDVGPPRRDPCERTPHAARADDDDSHDATR
jgi:hypothetical protein